MKWAKTLVVGGLALAVAAVLLGRAFLSPALRVDQATQEEDPLRLSVTMRRSHSKPPLRLDERTVRLKLANGDLVAPHAFAVNGVDVGSKGFEAASDALVRQDFRATAGQVTVLVRGSVRTTADVLLTGTGTPTLLVRAEGGAVEVVGDQTRILRGSVLEGDHMRYPHWQGLRIAGRDVLVDVIFRADKTAATELLVDGFSSASVR